MIDGFTAVSSWLASSIVTIWDFMLTYSSVFGVALGALLLRRLVKLVGRLIRH